MRTMASYDRLNLTPDHISHASQIVSAYGGKNSASIERALRDLATFDNSTPRQVLVLLRWHLVRTYEREAAERARHWRPMK